MISPCGSMVILLFDETNRTMFETYYVINQEWKNFQARRKIKEKIGVEIISQS